jgi:hypothetical protein
MATLLRFNPNPYRISRKERENSLPLQCIKCLILLTKITGEAYQTTANIVNVKKPPTNHIRDCF